LRDVGAGAFDFGAAAHRGRNPSLRFTKGERGKFFRQNAELRLPIYLDAEVQGYLAEQAARKGISLNE
jgi:hypothetical protein